MLKVHLISSFIIEIKLMLSKLNFKKRNFQYLFLIGRKFAKMGN